MFGPHLEQCFLTCPCERVACPFQVQLEEVTRTEIIRLKQYEELKEDILHEMDLLTGFVPREES